MENLSAVIDNTDSNANSFGPAIQCKPEFTTSTPKALKPILRRHSIHSSAMENKNVSFDLDRNDVFIFDALHCTGGTSTDTRTNDNSRSAEETSTDTSTHVNSCVDKSGASETNDGVQSEEQHERGEGDCEEDSDWSEDSEPSPVKQPKYMRAALPYGLMPPKKPVSKRFQTKAIEWAPRIHKHHRDVLGFQMSKFFGS